MASRINRQAAKSGCAYEWGGWGRLSDDGPGQHNPDRSEGPWGRAVGSARTEVPYPRIVPDSEQGIHGESSGHEGRWQTRFFLGKALSDIPALKPYPENSPYGILGEAMETSASFEARSAPLPYPTTGMK
jgi:hypothetical protein